VIIVAQSAGGLSFRNRRFIALMLRGNAPAALPATLRDPDLHWIPSCPTQGTTDLFVIPMQYAIQLID